jgi:hypothetical protein
MISKREELSNTTNNMIVAFFILIMLTGFSFNYNSSPALAQQSLEASTVNGNATSPSNQNITGSNIVNPSVNLTGINTVEKMRTVNLQQLMQEPQEFGSIVPGQKINLEEVERTMVSPEVFESLKSRSNETETLGFSPIGTAKLILFDSKNIQRMNFTTNTNSNGTNSASSSSSVNSPLLNNGMASANQTMASSREPGPSFSNINIGFEGLNINTGCGGGCYPPDVTVAAGPNHVVEMVNTGMQIWDKAGSSLSMVSLSGFYGTGPDSIFDPKIVFDQQSNRWFAALADAGDGNCNPQCSILVAVSLTDDPTGSWNIYSFPFGNLFSDQPIIATSDDKLAISVNDFDSTGFVGAQVYVADKNAMISGSSVTFTPTVPDPTLFSIHPAQSLSSSPCVYMVSVNALGTTALQLFSACGDPKTGVTFTHEGDIPMAPSSVPPSGTQPGPTTVDTGDGRSLTAAYYGGTIWHGFNDACIPGGTTIQSCVRVQKLDITNLGSLLVDTNIGENATDTYYPALSMNDAGEMLMVFGTSGPNIFPSLIVGGDDSNFASLVVGSSSITEDRYGDYFGAGTDPNRKSVWVAGEYVNSTLPNTWSTFIGNIS